MSDSQQQLSLIQNMFSAGQRNLRIERHTLLLWGGLIGVLTFVSDKILTHEHIPDNQQRAFAWLFLLVTLLGVTAFWDWKLTREVKQARDEIWSFIHRQVFKVWLVLLSIGCLMTFAMFFFGGGYMLYAAWLVLLGLGLYVHGLFSEELLEWVGGSIVLIGIAMMACKLNMQLTQWIAAAVTGLGFPLLTLLLDRGKHRSYGLRMAQTLMWLGLVLVPPLLVYQWQSSKPLFVAEQAAVNFRDYDAHNPALQILHFPRGTVLPVQFDVRGDMFQAQTIAMPLTLNVDVDVVLQNNKPTGLSRVAGQNWQSQGSRSIHIPWIHADMTAQGPQISSQLIISTQP